MCMFPPTKHGNKTNCSFCGKTGLSQELLLAGSTGCAVSLSLCPTETSTTPQASQPGVAVDAHHVMPQGTSHRALAAGYKQLLWAAEQSFSYSGKSVFTHCESQFLSAPPFQLPGEHHLGSPTAVQALSVYISILLLQAEQPRTHFLFLPQLILPRILHLFKRISPYHNTLSSFIHHTFLSTYVQGCSPLTYTVTVLESPGLPHCIRNYSLGRISCYLASLLQAWAYKGLFTKMPQGSQKGSPCPPSVPVLNFNCQTSRPGYQTKRSVQFPGAKETQLICTASNLLLV